MSPIERTPVVLMTVVALLIADGQLHAESPRPNILLVHCHDLGQFVHCYGVRTVQTPSLDRLAAEGVRFSQSFCTAPQCSPSRASLFTGRWPHCNGVMGLCHANFAWDLNPDERHMAQILHEAGYTTAAVGVIHETASGWRRCGYERYLPRAPQSRPPTRPWNFSASSAASPRSRSSSASVSSSRIGCLTASRNGRGRCPGIAVFRAPLWSPIARWAWRYQRYLRDTEGTRRELAGLQGAVRHVDTQVGRLMAALQDSGLAQNTLVVFTTDHGIAMPRAKCSLYEPGVQVAMLLRLPSRKGWNGGIVRTEMISNIDCLPTLLEVAGVPVPGTVQGRSFAPLLDGKAYRPREEIFTELTYHDYYDPRRAIRTHTHKLIVNFTTAPVFMDPSQCWRPSSDVVVPANHAAAYHPDVELYDLARDPWEQKDVAGAAAYASIRRELLSRLYQHLVETKDPILQGAVISPQHRRAVDLLEAGQVKQPLQPIGEKRP